MIENENKGNNESNCKHTINVRYRMTMKWGKRTNGRGNKRGRETRSKEWRSCVVVHESPDNCASIKPY
jgi:hypothetical protein